MKTSNGGCFVKKAFPNSKLKNKMIQSSNNNILIKLKNKIYFGYHQHLQSCYKHIKIFSIYISYKIFSKLLLYKDIRRTPIQKIPSWKIPTNQTAPWWIPHRKTPTQKIPTWNIPTRVFRYSHVGFLNLLFFIIIAVIIDIT